MKNLLETESLPNVRILFQQMKDSIITNFNSIYIKGSTPISWSSSGGQRERDTHTHTHTHTERKREEESTLLWLSSLARVRLYLRCFGFFFLSFQGGAILEVFFSKFRSSSSKSKVFPENLVA